jgi:tRNA1(Val) A37 N6-methylase TrmN6
MEIYSKYKPSSILDFCAGWGGRLIGACALNVPQYIGIDINIGLEQHYNKITEFFDYEERKKLIKVKTQFKIFYENAVTFDYSKIEYDMVLTSPPYYFLEKYSNNVIYDSKTEMKDKFYVPVITNSFNHLKEHGYYCLNVNEQIYEDICVILLGKAHQKIPLKKSKRQNEYTEYIYIWKKGYKPLHNV